MHIRGRMDVNSLKRLQYKQKDSFTQFDEKVCSLLQANYYVLDVGCGRVTRAAIKGSCQMAVGVDADQRVCSNLGVDSIVHGNTSSLPFKDNTFDLAMSWMVVEHLDNPQECFAELRRVCKKDATVVVVTPNVFHYANLIVKLTPYRFHEWFTKHILKGSFEESFPTRYRANSPRRLAGMMRKAGFKVLEMRCIDEGPVYLDTLAPLYAVGLIYHRLVNCFTKLSFLRLTIFGVFARKD